MAVRKLNLGAGSDFDRELKRLARRIERINALRRGDANYEVIAVDRVWVKGHRRKAHKRIIIRMNKPTKRGSK